LVLLAIVVLLLSLLPVRADEPVVRAVLFYSDSCPHCHIVLNEVLPPLQAQYGAQLEIMTIEISNNRENYDALLRLEAARGVPPEDGVVPELFVGQHMLAGSAEIREQLPVLIEELLAQGGSPWPQELAAEVEATPTPRMIQKPEDCRICDRKEQTEAARIAAARTPTPIPLPAIHLAYFYQEGCQECDRARLDLRYLEQRYPQLEVHEYSIRQHAALAEWLGERSNVPPEQRLTAPAAFVGNDALLGEQVNVRDLEAVLQRRLVTGSEAYWSSQADLAGAEAGILQRFRSFGPLTVAAAGLIDGLNPCAFATIVFLISYLSFMGHKGRRVLVVGAMFVAGVFFTYLGVGIGLLKALAALPFLHSLSRYLYAFTALLCLLLAIGSVYDAYQARRGRPEEMRLKLPTRLRRRINQVIRQGAGVRAMAGVSLLTGAAVSLIELACTGQVYLPTIIFVLGVPELRVRGLLSLLLYNLLFVLPLVIVFLLAYWGTSSERLARFINQRTGAIKLATAGLFLLLGVWMVTMLLG